MSQAERYQRAKTIFLEACELDSAQVPAYLQRECDGDSKLRRRVELMLEYDARGADLVGPAPPGAAGALGPGTQIGRYRIVGVIGEGGMGIVYEAEQENPRRTVALKVIRPGLASPAMLRRFEHEAQALARLQHPGIAQIHEAGQAEGPQGKLAFFAMEHVRGTPLLDDARRRELGLRERIELGARIADAVQHAHQRGVIHRDLKPANILVDDAGQPKVLDFGVARIVDQQHAATLLTSAGQILGTVAYMSPEQATGEVGAVDTRSDIYSLGVVLYELFTGRLPYPVTGVALHEALRVIAQAEPARLSSIDRRLRGDVSTIITRALEKDRARRYQASAELASDLRRHLRDEPIHARPPTAMYQLRKFARRHKAVAAGAAIASAAMLIGTAVSLRQAAVAIAARKLADENTLAAEHQAARALIAAGAQAAEAGDAITARRLLDSVREPRRSWEWRYRSARLDSSIALFELPEPVAAATIVAGGAEIVVATSSGTVRRLRIEGGDTVTDLRIDGNLTGPLALSTDGARLAGIVGEHQDKLEVWDAATGSRLASLDAAHPPVEVVAISPTGDRVAAGGAEAFLWEPATGTVTALGCPGTRVLAFSGNGERLAAVYTVWRYFRDFDARTGAHTDVAHRAPTDESDLIDMNDDGSLLLVGSRDKRFWLDRADRDARAVEFKGNTSAVRTVRFEPGGERVLSAGVDGAVRIWDAATGHLQATLAGHSGTVSCAGFGPGRRVWAASGKAVRIWDLPERDEIDVLRDHRSYVYAVVPLEGGRRVVSAAWDGTLRAWDARTGECLATTPSLHRVFSLAVLPASPSRPAQIVTGHDPPEENEPGLFGLWSAVPLQHLRDLRSAHAGRVIALGATADGDQAALRFPSGVEVFRTADWSSVGWFRLASPSAFSAVAFSPDGSRLAADGPGSDITVWDLRHPEQATTLSGHGGAVFDLAFSPDGRLLASGSADSTVRLWDVPTGSDVGWRPPRTLAGHTDSVYALAFSPDGTRLASGSNDTSIRLWDVASGEPADVLRGHSDYIFSLAFLPDGSALVSGSGDSTVRVWDTRPARLRWAERTAMAHRRDSAAPMVNEMFGRLGDWVKVASEIRADGALTADQREAALQVVLGRSVGSEPASGDSAK